MNAPLTSKISSAGSRPLFKRIQPRNLNPTPFSSLPRNPMPINPTPRPLPINVHRNRKKTNSNGNSPNRKENIPRPLRRQPIIQIIGKTESEEILDEIHCSEGLACFLTMAVYDVGYDTCGAELDAEVYKPKADDDGDFPWGEGVGGLAPGEEAGSGEKEVGYHDW